jgi:hypothetical protein
MKRALFDILEEFIFEIESSEWSRIVSNSTDFFLFSDLYFIRVTTNENNNINDY